MNTHFVLERTAVDVVALANRAIAVDAEFGHDKQRDPFGARGRIRQARQHDVHDVA